MLNDILIRKGNFNDVSSIHHIEKTVFNEEAWSLNMVEDELSTSNYRKTWVACVKNFLCAYYMLRSYENDYHLINIAVVPFYQRLGLGEKLSEVKEAESKKAIKQLDLDKSSKSTQSIENLIREALKILNG